MRADVPWQEQLHYLFFLFVFFSFGPVVFFTVLSFTDVTNLWGSNINTWVKTTYLKYNFTLLGKQVLLGSWDHWYTSVCETHDIMSRFEVRYSMAWSSTYGERTIMDEVGIHLLKSLASGCFQKDRKRRLTHVDAGYYHLDTREITKTIITIPTTISGTNGTSIKSYKSK